MEPGKDGEGVVDAEPEGLAADDGDPDDVAVDEGGSKVGDNDTDSEDDCAEPVEEINGGEGP